MLAAFAGLLGCGGARPLDPAGQAGQGGGSGQAGQGAASGQGQIARTMLAGAVDSASNPPDAVHRNALSDVLTEVELDGMTFGDPIALSADGRFLVGHATCGGAPAIFRAALP